MAIGNWVRGWTRAIGRNGSHTRLRIEALEDRLAPAVHT